MHRTNKIERGRRLSMVMVVFLLAFSLAASGNGPSTEKVASLTALGIAAPGQVNCAQAPGFSEGLTFQLPEGGSCRADSTLAPLPDWTPVFGRTCRCSCGYPCKTDADCGGGIGSCRGGISCC